MYRIKKERLLRAKEVELEDRYIKFNVKLTNCETEKPTMEKKCFQKDRRREFYSIEERATLRIEFWEKIDAEANSDMHPKSTTATMKIENLNICKSRECSIRHLKQPAPSFHGSQLLANLASSLPYAHSLCSILK